MSQVCHCLWRGLAEGLEANHTCFFSEGGVNRDWMGRIQLSVSANVDAFSKTKK